MGRISRPPRSAVPQVLQLHSARSAWASPPPWPCAAAPAAQRDAACATQCDAAPAAATAQRDDEGVWDGGCLGIWGIWGNLKFMLPSLCHHNWVTRISGTSLKTALVSKNGPMGDWGMRLGKQAPTMSYHALPHFEQNNQGPELSRISCQPTFSDSPWRNHDWSKRMNFHWTVQK